MTVCRPQAGFLQPMTRWEGWVQTNWCVCVCARACTCVCVGHCFACFLPTHLREEGPLSGNSLLADLPFLPKPRY